ncbi:MULTISPECIES: type II toxin-antitoxin system YafQ family toxin [unclassified Actinobaculum]|uniref:type II toxin-antitoxin system RelE/ParE family toxin n=1 Tax=unclassified Actinobaculum TaxID=2609299 RepID=UPI000D52984F|nr:MULTISPECIES: type II toxin-antitoxin system YafQ family toxin [unclassified Actinobaculum]AWE41877.1 type II toxin-antitoxin system mRNA interferase toxin, RelE/StbE family [Actinobaculum sp. 313]RTE50205.1 type II toxin-antitoxin system YafQ family toxin [Actinobaculum sp. 352]
MHDREIAYRPAFLRDVKRLKRKHYSMDALKSAIQAVAERRTDWLKRHRDHQFTGNLAAYRELHIAADWLLLYTIAAGTLILARTGGHDELL